MRHIILGTAGHIDHGKSSLVKALTGTDPDRLKEEKERGITIDIGFADLLYPEKELSVGIVDVPGHERLIRNMLAGAVGIDMVLLVIAADEGIMPQSREHLAICNLLRIKSGLVVVTKSDLVERDWLDLVCSEIRDFVKGTFLQDSPIVPVSSRTGANLDLLKKDILDIGCSITPKSSAGLFRMPIDRVFTLKGFGTVVTGTAVSGRVSLEDPLEIVPAGIQTKVRGLHSHGRSIEKAFAGQRVAINLQGVEKLDLRRGDVAVTPESFHPSKNIDGFLEMLANVPSLKNRSLVHFYSGTSEAIARVILYEKGELNAGESCYCQFRLSEPVIAVSGDRYIIRRFSPLETMGGGEILDPSPARRSRKKGTADLDILHTGTLDQKISLKVEAAGKSGIRAGWIAGWINTDLQAARDSIERLKKSGVIVQYEDLLLHGNVLSSLQTKMAELLANFHKNNPLKPGMAKEEARTHLGLDPRLFSFVLTAMKNIVTEQNIIRLKEFRIALSSNEEEVKAKILQALEQAGFQPPSKEELALFLKMDTKRLTDILGILSKEGKVVRVNEAYYLSGSSYQQTLALLRDFFSKKAEMSVAEFRDLLNTSRKYALPLLEFLDSNKITLRTGDVRKFLLKR
ncbi:MAG: selenocysteine-specific translation elongation factor [Nitrospiraceae bacterium]|nr:selenocysteine-specific translation elongation factor [Nitrospiraceae bacterium]